MGAIVWVINGCWTLRVEHVQCAISVRHAMSILNAQVSYFSERSLKVRIWSSELAYDGRFDGSSFRSRADLRGGMAIDRIDM